MITFDQITRLFSFDTKKLKKIWDQIIIEEIDGCDPEERLKDYIDDKPNCRMMGTPE